MWQRATELDPDSYAAFNGLGGALLYQGKNEEATAAFEKSIAIRPNYSAYSNIAVALFQLRRFPDSVRNYREAVKLDASEYQTWGNMGDSLYYGGDTASAMDAYRKAIALAEQQLKVNPRDPLVLADLASYHSMLGDRKEALSYLDQSLQLGHSDKELLLNAATVYNQLHETGPALEWLSKALAAGYSHSVVAKCACFDNLHENPRYRALLETK
jgi:tetratricopeptide (TPR) repeat protein